MNVYEVKPYRDRRLEPAVSVYVLDNYSCTHLEKISCIFCKRTVWDMFGRIDKMILSPLPLTDYGVAINIQCKQCHQMYRLVSNAK